MAKVQTVSAKIGNMRKPQDFVVYPKQVSPNSPAGNNETLTVQSDTVIAKFDIKTGIGIYANQPGGAYFITLAIKGKPLTVPPDILAAFIAAQPKSGDTMAGGICRIA